MTLKFISVLSSDKLELPALLYSPDTATKKVAVWLHGMGDSGVFYKPVLMNALGEALTEEGIALLALNNRGAHNAKQLKIAVDTLPEADRSYQGGSMFEKIEDCVHDIDGAATFLEAQGYTELYLVGHSTGANKICAYHARRPSNPFARYIMAGPGDDVGLFFTELGEEYYWQALHYAAKHVELHPMKLMPLYTGMAPFSVQSAWDILNPDGAYNTFPYFEATQQRLGKKPLFEEYRRIDKPALVIAGAEDAAMHTAGGVEAALQLFMRHTNNAQLKQTDFQTVGHADHSFHGRETAFAKQITDWLIQ